MDELYNNYEKISLTIIQEIQNNNLDCIAELMNRRKKILDQINEFVSKEELANYFDKMIKLDNDINSSLYRAKEDIKNELITLKKQKSANSIYGKQFTDIYFINKQI